MPAQQNNMMLINTRDDARAFVTSYNQAKSTYKTSFTFKGREILVSYAYFTIEYMAMTKMLLTGNFDKDRKFIIE